MGARLRGDGAMRPQECNSLRDGQKGAPRSREPAPPVFGGGVAERGPLGAQRAPPAARTLFVKSNDLTCAPLTCDISNF
jgi:hypothetical protein